ncbi:hypothetical protein EQG41_18060 [Billgrantia azerbaijanica]|nr:hypothetical protein EQG41_18060 [Halomonas azerbaijanica]
MKHYNARGLRKPFNHPFWGRPCLFLFLLVFPIIAPPVVLWEKRKDLIDEWLECAQATFLPWKNRR